MVLKIRTIQSYFVLDFWENLHCLYVNNLLLSVTDVIGIMLGAMQDKLRHYIFTNPVLQSIGPGSVQYLLFHFPPLTLRLWRD